jgi:hypothetical protein
MKFRVGKRSGTGVVPAFDIEQTGGGGVRFSNIHSLTDADRHNVMAHYGRAFRGRFVLKGEQHFRNLKPGTAMHFEHASYQLPTPFQLLPKG